MVRHKSNEYTRYYNIVAQRVILIINRYSVVFQVSSTAVNDIITGVKEQIISKQVPKSIVGAHCNYNDTIFTQVPYEDFVQPNKTNEYRIHSYYLQQQQSNLFYWSV